MDMGPALANVAENIAKQGTSRVLVAGGRGDNFPPRWREHPQLVFWETEGKSPSRFVVPSDVRLVLSTRFVSHAIYNAVADECAARNIYFSVKPLGTGEIKNILKPFMNGHADNEPTADEPTTETQVAEVETATMKTASGVLKAFVLKHADLNATPLAKEAERVWKLAKDAGIKTTDGSIKNSMYVLRKGSGLPPLRPSTRPNAALKKIAKTSTIGAPVAPSFAMGDDDVTIIQMLDDAAAAFALVRQTLVERASKRHQLRELLKSI
jgi:hypothetical protein